MSSFRSGRQLGIINRNDPSSGLVIVLVLMLALNVFQGGQTIPPAKQIITILICFIIATSIHEFMHAYTALRLGDDTAESLGRITLNPAAHFEPFGFFGMVMISLGFSFIGWGKPVPVNPNRFHARGVDGRKRSMALVAVAGPISNVVQAAFAAAIIRLATFSGADLGNLGYFLNWFLIVNVLLASFNMIPIPPLDGHKILVGILPNFWYPVLAPLERYGFMIIFVLFFATSWLRLPSITNEMISPIRSLLLRVLL